MGGPSHMAGQSSSRSQEMEMPSLWVQKTSAPKDLTHTAVFLSQNVHSPDLMNPQLYPPKNLPGRVHPSVFTLRSLDR